MVTRGLIAGLLFPLSVCAWAWEEDQVLEFVTAYNPLIRAHQAVTKEYMPSNAGRWLMEHTTVFARSSTGTSTSVSESGDTTTTSPSTVGIQINIPLSSPKERRELAEKSLQEATRIDEIRRRVITDLAQLRTHEADLAAAKQRWGKDSLAGRTIAVQGAGKVAWYLCQHLKQEGAKLIVTDIDDAKVKRLVEETGAAACAPEAIYDQKADIYAPCALGATINDDTLKRLKVEIIAGGANNQLAEERHGTALEQQGLLYAPDFVINAGGLINVYREIVGWSEERAKRKAQEIYDTILRVFAIAGRDRIPTYEAADRLAEERIEAAGRLSRMYFGRRTS